MADTITVAEIESAIDAIETQGRYIALHGLPGACPSEQDCRAFESFMRSGYAAKEKLCRMATAIKQREQDANNPLKGWIFDKVTMGRGDERYICTPDGANATTVRNESTSDHRERLLWLIADAMVKESGNG